MKFHEYRVAYGRLPWLSKALTLILLISLNQNFLFPQKSVAAEQEWVTSKLTIASGGVVMAKFDTQKGVPLFISIRGAQRTSASGFTGSCYFFPSNDEFSYQTSKLLGGLKFKDGAVNFQNFIPDRSSDYSFECKNESVSEVAIVELSFFSIRNISSQNRGILKVPALSIRIIKFAAKNNELALISIKGSRRTTASGFSGNCNLYRADGRAALPESGGSSFFPFKDESVSYKFFQLSKEDYFLICANDLNEEAKLSFAMYNTSSVAIASNLFVNIPGNGIKVLEFSGLEGEDITLTAKGGARTTPSGFSGKCDYYTYNAMKPRYYNFVYSSLNFKDQTKKNVKFMAPYTGPYYLVCRNESTESAKIQFGGISNLNEVKSSNSFFGYSDQSTQNSQPTPSASPTSGPSVGQGDVTTAIDLTLEAQGSVKKIETGNFTSADILRALEAANKAVEIANKALKAASSADVNSSKARITAENALDEAKKVQQLARSLEKANKSINNLKSAVGNITNSVKAMTVESACRDKRAKVSANLSITSEVFDFIPVVGDIFAPGLSIASSRNDLEAIKKCKGK